MEHYSGITRSTTFFQVITTCLKHFLVSDSHYHIWQVSHDRLQVTGNNRMYEMS